MNRTDQLRKFRIGITPELLFEIICKETDLLSKYPDATVTGKSAIHLADTDLFLLTCHSLHTPIVPEGYPIPLATLAVIEKANVGGDKSDPKL